MLLIEIIMSVLKVSASTLQMSDRGGPTFQREFFWRFIRNYVGEALLTFLLPWQNYKAATLAVP